MGLGHYLFSFGGRINRAKQWAILLVGLAFEFIVVTAFGVIVGTPVLSDLVHEKITPAAFIALPQARTFAVVFCVLYLLMLYVAAAVTVKRLHDRNKSAWWLLVFYVAPIVLSIPGLIASWDMLQHMNEFIKAAQTGAQLPMQQSALATIGNGASTILSLWAFVELFILRGTVGDNRYGPDPLATRA